MQDDFVSLYAYNRWANSHVLDACGKLTPEQYVAEPAPGWASVRSTLVHIAVVTDGWLRGMAGESVQSLPTEADLPTVEDAARVLDQAYRRFDELLPTLTPEQMAAPRMFRGRRGDRLLPPWVVLRHIVNHTSLTSTHRRDTIKGGVRFFEEATHDDRLQLRSLLFP
jgi:uncharacterized damage-inducible protein DinB